MSAEIISLCERRAAAVEEPVIDLVTAIDVAIRDLCEIETMCEAEDARQRAAECRRMLVMALAADAGHGVV